MDAPKRDLSAELRKPFAPWDIEWKIQTHGKYDGGVWAMAVAYVDARAVAERLDSVFTVTGWQVQYRHNEAGGMIARLGVRDPETGEWVWKEDVGGTVDSGPGMSQGDATKGEASAALKRVGSVLGVGRYLYGLPATFAKTRTDKPPREERDLWTKAKLKVKGGPDITYWWRPPELPGWALPDDYRVDEKTGEVVEGDRPMGTSPAAPLGVRYETTRNIALNCEAITNEEGAAMDAAANKSEAHMERAIERLEERIQVKKLSPTPEHEPDPEPEREGVAA